MYVRRNLHLIHLICCLIFGLVGSTRGSETVTNAQELLSIQKKFQNDVCFTVSGRILIPPFRKNLPFFIDINGSCTKVYSRLETAKGLCQAGDLVLLSGRTRRSGSGETTHLDCTSLQTLARGSLPDAPVVSVSDYTGGDYANKRVAVMGTLADAMQDDIDAQYLHATLADKGQIAYLIWQGAPDDLNELRRQQGATVVATGIGYRNFGVRVFAPTPPLLISGTNAIHVISKNDHDPFDVPEITTSGPWRGIPEFGKTRKLKGLVSTRWNGNSFLLRMSNGKSARVETSDESLPPLGSTAEAVGRLETDFIDLYLLRASWRKAKDMGIPPAIPVETTLRALFTNNSGSGMIKADNQGSTYRIRGIVKNVGADTKGFKSILLADGEHSILVNCSNVKNTFESVAEGCIVEVTGVCVKDSDIWRPSFMIPRVRGLFLVPRSDADLKVLRRPPWWTPVRFVVALTILFGVIVAILVWNATLRVLVVRKSRAVLREQAAKIEETLKIDERTRLAAELHDYLAQNLTVISYQISAAESALAADSAEATDCLRTADRMLLSCRADLRRCLWDLKSDALNEPEFAKAIRRTSEPVAGDARLLVRFAANRSRLSDSTAHAVLSICRELVSNAVRHGKADKVQIAGELRDGAIRFSVRDNGGGFDPAKRPGQADGHFGLDGVAERIRRFNGQLRIDSRPGRGTRIVVTLRPKEPQT